MTPSPLAGRSVVITRARPQASELARRLAGLGATVVELPVIAIEDPDDRGRELARAAHRLASGAYQWVALTSSNAASRLLAELGDRAVAPSVRWAAVGAATARTLAEADRSVDLIPEVSMAEALAEAFPTAGPDGPEPVGTVLYPRADTVSGSLAAGLRAKGWLVDEVVAYRTVSGRPEPEAVAATSRADAVAFTSSSTVTRSVDLVGADGLPPIVVTIGPVTSATARSAGLAVAAEANPHTIEGVVEAVVAALGADGGAAG
ncbi:MAG TPA: uroporphyrinogen-III synthase [Acidimicrobiales bacterium]|jgi:uroporphyrinogen-III synthase|nr:uroporphyrinogen-III synthase [Acidimicrobiales bacterium]